MSDRCVKSKDNKNCFIGTKEFEIFYERLKNINEVEIWGKKND